jgi:hypothetical protein
MNCLNCGAPSFSRKSRFCTHCRAPLVRQVSPMKLVPTHLRMPLYLALFFVAAASLFWTFLRMGLAAPFIGPLLGSQGLKVAEWVSGGSAALAAYGLLAGFSDRCPNCKEWWARKILKRDLIGRSKSWRTEYTTTEHRDSHGLLKGTSRHERRVPVLKSTYRCHNRCSHCSYEWESQESETT